MAITFQGIDPSLFNFGSDLVAVAGRVLLGLSLAHLYKLVISWQLRSGKKIPVTEIGNGPGNWFTAGRLARALHWSLPALVLLALYVAADFSQSLADLGLRFVTVDMEGDNDHVIDLSRRNFQRLIQVSGLSLDLKLLYSYSDMKRHCFNSDSTDSW